VVFTNNTRSLIKSIKNENEKITNTYTSLEINLTTRFAIKNVVLGSGGRNGLDRNNVHCFGLNCHKIKLR